MRVERQLRLEVQHSASGVARFAEVADLWWGGRPGLAATTMANYRDNLDNHILPTLGDKAVGEIRPRLVAMFLAHLAVSKGLAPGTVRKVRTVLSTVMFFAVAMEYVESNPVMKVPPPAGTRSERLAPTVEETARILLGAEQVDPDFLAYLWVAAEEGGRRGETLALRWRDVDLVNGTITIERTISIGDDGVRERARTKSGRSRTLAVSPGTVCQLVGLHERTEALLSEAAGTRVSLGTDALVFSGGTGSRRHPLDGKPWRPDSTSRRFRRVKDHAGVREEIDLHGLRHTMITEMLAAGVDPRTVMGRAGHSSEVTTMTVYAKVRPVVDTAAAQLWGRILEDQVAALRGAGCRTAVGPDIRLNGDRSGGAMTAAN